MNQGPASGHSSDYYSNQSSVNVTANNSVTSPMTPLTLPNRVRLNSQPTAQQQTGSMHIQSNNLPVSSILSNSNKSIYVLFNKVWNLLIDMQNDPYPDVAEFAQRVVSFFVSKAYSFDLLKRNTILQQNQSSRRFSNDITNQANQTDSKDDKDESISITTDFVPW